MKRHAQNISLSASQRVTEEIIKLMSCGAAKACFEHLLKIGLFEILFPEVYAILDEPAEYFDSKLSIREFLLEHLAVMDLADQGKRNFQNPMYLVLILGHLGGKAIHDIRDSGNLSADPGAILNEALRPISQRMGFSRRDLSRIKQILIAYPKMVATKRGRRFRLRDLIRRDYFTETLELMRQIAETTKTGMDRYEYWRDRLLEHDGHENQNRSHGGLKSGKAQSDESPRGGRKRRRRKRPRRRRRKPASTTGGGAETS